MATDWVDTAALFSGNKHFWGLGGEKLVVRFGECPNQSCILDRGVDGNTAKHSSECRWEFRVSLKYISRADHHHHLFCKSLDKKPGKIWKDTNQNTQLKKLDGVDPLVTDPPFANSTALQPPTLHH